ncbi:hypothetical protein Sa4125_14790 [Aureimonas sp. SA4125]|uniref:NAD(P)/FAD-dependent oxidoreductase n=1 Tax=Aureimonas sp. SA4125 TaxID=2826993 RepID=UPI001CC7AA41|nr:NAD(P)/FAD-dependent oxidoreductase [Aureimonas sp. SA4125]BDA83937.1 hypothetical protein Sa4125_14790 [Aureimonas sp. SA4125]
MDRVDCIVAGAGVIGLAVARGLAQAGREVLIIEPEHSIGSQTSSRNSEVIHAGIYYPVASSKAQLCVDGRERLYAYARERGIAHRRCGKLIVATDASQVVRLEAIRSSAAACGVEDLALVDASDARRMEPALRAQSALLSPSTGIIDSHGYMLALQGDAEDAGAQIVFDTVVDGGRIRPDGTVVIATRQRGDTDVFELATALFINCGGLQAQRIAEAIEGFPSTAVPCLHMAKGNYFAAGGRSPFSRLIYPVPVDGGLGVHLTFDLAGQMRFGPDVEWIEAIDYRVDPQRGQSFYDEIRRYWPGLPDDGLSPAYSGIRPKLSGPGQPAADFAIEGPETHGVQGVINLFGIESPGLTASLSIAERVVTLAS